MVDEQFMAVARGILGLCVLFATYCSQESACEFGLLLPDDPVVQDLYGNSVLLHDERLYVGAYAKAIGSNGGSGAVYIYDRCGPNWFLTQQLLPLPGTVPAFGIGLAVADDLLAVGTLFDNQGTGSVYVYRFDGTSWGLEQVLVPDTMSLIQQYGESVATDGIRIVVGVPADSTVKGNAGSVRILEQIAGVWTEVQRIDSPPAKGSARFGESVQLVKDVLIIGAPGEDSTVQNLGAVYVFEHDGSSFVQAQLLEPSDLSQGSEMGFPSFDGETIAAGAPEFDGVGGSSSGAVYVFEEIGGLWQETQRLEPSPPSGGAEFGGSVVVQGDWMVVGAGGDSAQGTVSGAVHLFQRSGGTWTQVAKVSGSETSTGDRLGASGVGDAVALDGDLFAAGAIFADTAAQDAGEVYTWSISGATCRTLSSNRAQVSLADGGVQTLHLAPGGAFADSFYALLGTTSGTDPGFSFAGLRVPLNVDGYLQSTLVPNTPPLIGNFGRFGSSGSSVVAVNVPPLSDPSLAGLRLDHAFAAFTLGPLSLDHVSNTVPLILVP